MARIKYWDENSQSWKYADLAIGTTTSSETGGTNNYVDLINKPKINGVELKGNKTSSDLNLPNKSDLDNKLNKNQGSVNNGKILGINEMGDVVPVDKPSSGGSGSSGTSNYTELINKPQINGHILNGNQTSDELGLQAKGNYATKEEIPKNTSQLTNNSGFLTQHQDISGKLDKNQGSMNNGKILGIDSQGNVIPIAKPSSGTGGTTDYVDLTNKPQINGHELNGNQTSSQLGIIIPTKLPNPHPITFTGNTTSSYNGSKSITVNIPTVQDILNALPKWTGGEY